MSEAKHAHYHTVEVECYLCRRPMTVLADTDGLACSYLGPPYHHDGCAGYPYCSCATPHQGDRVSAAATSPPAAASPAPAADERAPGTSRLQTHKDPACREASGAGKRSGGDDAD